MELPLAEEPKPKINHVAEAAKRAAASMASPQPKPERVEREPGEDEFREVDNPFALLPEKKEGEKPAKKQRVRVNVRETPIEMMFSRKQITDDEKTAADAFRLHSERVRIGGKVSDPSRPPAKGGVSDPMVAMRLDSARQLRIAHGILGQIDYWLLWETVTVGRSLTDLTKQVYQVPRGDKRFPRKVGHIAERIKDALALLVEKGWGLPAETRTKPRRSESGSKPDRFYRAFGALSTDISEGE